MPGQCSRRTTRFDACRPTLPRTIAPVWMKQTFRPDVCACNHLAQCLRSSKSCFPSIGCNSLWLLRSCLLLGCMAVPTISHSARQWASCTGGSLPMAGNPFRWAKVLAERVCPDGGGQKHLRTCLKMASSHTGNTVAGTFLWPKYEFESCLYCMIKHVESNPRPFRLHPAVVHNQQRIVGTPSFATSWLRKGGRRSINKHCSGYKQHRQTGVGRQGCKRVFAYQLGG